MFEQSENKILKRALKAMTLACESLKSYNERLTEDIKQLDQEVVALRNDLQDAKIHNTPNEY